MHDNIKPVRKRSSLAPRVPDGALQSVGFQRDQTCLLLRGLIGATSGQCLTPVEPMAPEEIRALREREKASQPVFAHYLNFRKDAVSKWERGEKRPRRRFAQAAEYCEKQRIASNCLSE